MNTYCYLSITLALTIINYDYVILFCLDDDVEENSGVEFPGESLEPYVGSSLTFDDVEFNNEVVLIELASPNFAYKYKDMGRV